MRVLRLATLLVGIAMLLAACGRIPPTSSATPPPSSAQSPTAAATPLAIAVPSLHSGEVGLAYTQVTLQATGGNDPFMWRISDGALPRGLALSLDGVISGIPTSVGNFNFTVEVTDASMATANVTGSIDVASQLVFRYIDHAYNTHTGYPILNVCVMPRADHPCPNPDDRALQFATVSGGVGPYTYVLGSGTLPPMSSLNRVGLSWQPASYGPGALSQCDYQITVRVTDSLGASVVVGCEYWLYRT